MFCGELPCACNVRTEKPKAKKAAPLKSPSVETHVAPEVKPPLANIATAEMSPSLGRSAILESERRLDEARAKKLEALKALYYSSLFNKDSQQKLELENAMRLLGWRKQNESARDWKERWRKAGRTSN